MSEVRLSLVIRSLPIPCIFLISVWCSVVCYCVRGSVCYRSVLRRAFICKGGGAVVAGLAGWRVFLLVDSVAKLVGRLTCVETKK